MTSEYPLSYCRLPDNNNLLACPLSYILSYHVRRLHRRFGFWCSRRLRHYYAPNVSSWVVTGRWLIVTLILRHDFGLTVFCECDPWGLCTNRLLWVCDFTSILLFTCTVFSCWNYSTCFFAVRRNRPKANFWRNIIVKMLLFSSLFFKDRTFLGCLRLRGFFI